MNFVFLSKFRLLESIAKDFRRNKNMSYLVFYLKEMRSNLSITAWFQRFEDCSSLLHVLWMFQRSRGLIKG